jgi:hypothetical protein
MFVHWPVPGLTSCFIIVDTTSPTFAACVSYSALAGLEHHRCNCGFDDAFVCAPDPAGDADAGGVFGLTAYTGRSSGGAYEGIPQ